MDDQYTQLSYIPRVGDRVVIRAVPPWYADAERFIGQIGTVSWIGEIDPVMPDAGPIIVVDGVEPGAFRGIHETFAQCLVLLPPLTAGEG